MPHYQHDCPNCIDLGDHTQDGHTFDLYVCPTQIGGPTVIARFGDDGPDYKSGLCFARPGTVLGEAKRRAEEKGVL